MKRIAYRKIHLKIPLRINGVERAIIYCGRESAVIRRFISGTFAITVVHCPADIWPDLDIPWDNVAALEEPIELEDES
jgi:hypothetical protein